MSSRYGLSIRAARAADAEGIGDLMRAADLSFQSRGLAERLEAIPTERGLVLLAMEWGPPSGLISVHWSWLLETDLKAARVTALVVDPEQRRKGIARLLLKAASQAARIAGCGELRMNPPTDALHLRVFGLATGFTDLGHELVRPLRKQT